MGTVLLSVMVMLDGDGSTRTAQFPVMLDGENGSARTTAETQIAAAARPTTAPRPQQEPARAQTSTSRSEEEDEAPRPPWRHPGRGSWDGGSASVLKRSEPSRAALPYAAVPLLCMTIMLLQRLRRRSI